MRPLEARIAEAAAALRRGGVVAYPTETLYGLGALAGDAAAVARLAAAKGRPDGKPMPLAGGRPGAARAGGRARTAGPPARRGLLARAAHAGGAGGRRAARRPSSGGGRTVGVRVTSGPVAAALCRAAGGAAGGHQRQPGRPAAGGAGRPALDPALRARAWTWCSTAARRRAGRRARWWRWRASGCVLLRAGAIAVAAIEAVAGRTAGRAGGVGRRRARGPAGRGRGAPRW